MSKMHNFSAGPCILPGEVLQQSSKSVLEFNNMGLSLIEISHRDKNFVEVMENARNIVKELLGVPNGYTVLFLQGGASLGFIIAANNFMRLGGKGAYIETGAWAENAGKEARHFGQVDIIASSKADNYTFIPKNYKVPSDADYLHYTSNNTVYGTQFKSVPSCDIPLVCDMSSDIFSKKIDVSKFDLIYAGAQKNMGPAGATLYIVKDEAIGRTGREIPAYLNLGVHAKKDSMFNTPPVFSVYVSMLMMQWMRDQGGVSRMEELNNKKAALIYSEIDRNPLFKGTCAIEDRSVMNATFVLTDEQHKDRFDNLWKSAGISGIKGHRSVGGYRASMYNALPVESVQQLVDCMKELERTA
ncbi:MAG: 3-phosphoserine/phosphohydroxythreonine transaminase [Flavobacteriales bacterium]|jgi:phosphoserine aminotransferase|nr:3-phosphoserine/phosphohydroxythreonine transaminase [Flavobacteriales bacterium]